jgi:hypothetical protein
MAFLRQHLFPTPERTSLLNRAALDPLVVFFHSFVLAGNRVGYKLNWIEGAQAIVFILSIPFVSYAIAFRFRGDRERITTYLFYGTMAVVVLIQARVPVGILAMLNFAISAWMWKRYFYNFEFQPKQ